MINSIWSNYIYFILPKFKYRICNLYHDKSKIYNSDIFTIDIVFKILHVIYTISRKKINSTHTVDYNFTNFMFRHSSIIKLVEHRYEKMCCIDFENFYNDNEDAFSPILMRRLIFSI